MGKFRWAKERGQYQGQVGVRQINRLWLWSTLTDFCPNWAFLNLQRAQFPKFQKLVCKTGNPLPNTLKSTHLSELLSYPVCKDETLFFSVFDQGLEKMLATNVSGEFILPRDASGPYKVTCLSPTGLPVKIFHREKVNPEPSAVVTRIRREALFSCIGRLVILSLVQRGRTSKSGRSWVKSEAFLHRGDSERWWIKVDGHFKNDLFCSVLHF